MKKNKTDVSMKADNSIDPGAKAQTEQAAEVEMETKTVEPGADTVDRTTTCLLYTSPSPRDLSTSRMPSSA